MFADVLFICSIHRMVKISELQFLNHRHHYYMCAAVTTSMSAGWTDAFTRNGITN